MRSLKSSAKSRQVSSDRLAVDVAFVDTHRNSKGLCLSPILDVHGERGSDEWTFAFVLQRSSHY